MGAAACPARKAKKAKKTKAKATARSRTSLLLTARTLVAGSTVLRAPGGGTKTSRQSTTSRATTFKTRSSTTWPVTMWPRLMTATSRTSHRRGFPVVVLGSLLSGRSSLWRRKPTFLYCIKKKTLVHEEMNTIACFRKKKPFSRGKENFFFFLKKKKKKKKK